MSDGKSSKKITLMILALVIIVAVVLFFVFKPHHTLTKPVLIPVKNSLPTLGNKSAKVQIVAFEDLKCGNCKRYNESIFPQVKKQLIDTGKAKYSVVLLAFIPGSPPAANAAYCLYQQNPKYFFPFVKYTYKHQMGEDVDWATVSRLLQFASASVPAADMNKLSECMISGNFNKKVSDNLKLAEKVMGKAVATPSLYVNGHKVKDFTLNGIKALVEKTS